MQRLKTRSQFEAVLAGKTVARTPHFALHVRTLAQALGGMDQKPVFAPADEVWVGALVPKRWARHAVTRNAIKRQIYGVSSQFGTQLPKAAHVVRLRTAFARASFGSPSSTPLKRAIRQELVQLFDEQARAGQRPGA